MLVLGNKYKFTTLEKERLRKKNLKIHTITNINKDPQTLLQEIKEHLYFQHVSVIVVNTYETLDHTIIKYFTNLQFEKKTTVMTTERFMEKFLKKCYIPHNPKDLHYLDNIKPFSTWQYLQKRTIDYLGVFSILLLTFPILLYSRKRIKKESPGSSMFKQTRVGLYEKKFKCYKFRSMHLDSYHQPYTSKDDNRVFYWGKVMRKTRIDEIPQLLNVLKGDMHLIGPRAEWDILVKNYEQEIPYYNERHIVRPGITGWAQVMFPYGGNVNDAKQKLMYDLYYIKHWSILLELKVTWKTILVILGKKGI